MPELPAFQAVSIPLAEKIQKNVNLKGKVYALTFDTNINDCFVIKGKESFFLKVFPEEQFQNCFNIKNILDWLSQNNIKIPDIIEIRRNFLESKKIVVISKYISGNKIVPTEMNLKCLGAQIATLHFALSKYPSKEQLKASTTQRLNLLQDVRNKIANKKLSVSIEPKFLHRISNIHELDFADIQDAIPLHGDLNPGNVQISQNNEIIFFDFEDTLHSVLPVIFEIIYILERIIFISNLSLEEKKHLGILFLKAYKNNGGKYHYKKEDCYSAMALNLRSLCTLALCEQNGIKIINSEWEKFYHLYRFSENNLYLIENILKS